jgi:dihydroorotase
VYDLIIRDATIVSSSGRQVVDVAIAKGKIAYVGPRPPRRAREEIQAIGKFLMPGVVDTAVQFDPNGDPKIWERESRAAVTGGVTTVLSLPGGCNPVVDYESAKRRAEHAGGQSWCNFGLWGAAKNGNAAEIARATHEGLLVGTLVNFADNGDIGIQPGELQGFLDGSATIGVLLDVAGQNEEENDAVLQAARDHDRPIHLVHLSTAVELDLIDPVRGDLPVTAGVTPHHLFLSTDDIDNPIKTHPPVRAEQDRRTLWTAVKRGRLDCVASDHYPSASVDDNGVPGSELLFPLMLSAVKYGRLSLELLVSLCSESPARIFGLANKGRIVKGADADLVLFSEGEITRVQQTALMSGAGWSPYLDREAAPKPDVVIVNGEIAARMGELVLKKPNGRLVTLER